MSNSVDETADKIDAPRALSSSIAAGSTPKSSTSLNTKLSLSNSASTELKKSPRQNPVNLEKKVSTLEEEKMKIDQQLRSVTKLFNAEAEVSGDLRSEIRKLEDILRENQALISKRESELVKVLDRNDELKSVESVFAKLSEENAVLQAKLRVESQKNAELETKEKKSQIEISERDEKIKKLEVSVAEKEETMSKMARVLMKLKGRLATIEVEVAKFVVDKVYQFYPNSTGHLLVIQNPQSKSVHFDLIVNGKRHVYPVEDIVSVATSKADKSKFTLNMKDGSVETFSSKVRDEVVKELYEFIAQHRSGAERQNEKQKLTQGLDIDPTSSY